MRKFTWFVLALLATLVAVPVGCSTPDGDDMRNLERHIAVLSAAEKDLLAIETLHWRWRKIAIKENWRGREYDITISRVRCTNEQGHESERRISWAEFFDLMIRTHPDEYPMDLLEAFEASAVEDLAAAGYTKGCNTARDKAVAENADFLAGKKPGLSTREIAEMLLTLDSLPPFIPITGGIAELLPILCALGADYGCPDNPNYPGEPQQPTQPGDNGLPPDQGSP